MNARNSRALVLFVMGLAAAIVGFSGVLGTSNAQAQTWGAAQHLRVHSQHCTADGLARVTFAWSPSGHGQQWLDVSGINNNFASHFANAGPLHPYASSYVWDFYPNQNIYSRVNTWTSAGWQPSHTINFQTINCPGQFTNPSNPWSHVLSDSSVRVGWDRGVGNLFFCVDFAKSQHDLLNLTGSWFNRHCGTTATAVNVHGLDCGTTYHWRTWAAGHGTSGYTPIRTFTTQACAFQPAHSLHADPDFREIDFSWKEGTPAHWSCVDIAESVNDLNNFGTTWRNGCTTAEMITLSGFDCAKTYYWRVFSHAGYASGYSETKTIDAYC